MSKNRKYYIKRSPLKPSTKRIKRTPIKRTPIKRKRAKSKRAQANDDYERQVRTCSWANVPSYPNGSPVAPDGRLWQLDHVLPIAIGKKDKEVCTIERMSSWVNLQWLTVDDNMKKGARLTEAGRINREYWREDRDDELVELVRTRRNESR